MNRRRLPIHSNAVTEFPSISTLQVDHQRDDANASSSFHPCPGHASSDGRCESLAM